MCFIALCTFYFLTNTHPTPITQAQDWPDSLPPESELPEGFRLRAFSLKDSTATICLELPVDFTFDSQGVSVEALHAQVVTALLPVDWQALYVQIYDPVQQKCVPLAQKIPVMAPMDYEPENRVTLSDISSETVQNSTGSLAGKTVYISAGHGWNWTSYGWRTQRGVYQDFIEDHNNAEAVDQYLIPYLENAGATVIPMRERDWNATRVIGNNDDGGIYHESGTWVTSGATGYAGSTYRYALTSLGTTTATATWTLSVGTQGTYAVYVWFVPGSNRVPDAHYTVQHAGGSTEVILDQRYGPETWRYLGTFPFYAGQAKVILSNRSDIITGQAVIADAVRIGGGNFDSFAGIYRIAEESPYPAAPPYEPYWETAAYYYSQWMGMNPGIWSYFNDVVSRPLYARWNHAGTGEDAVYVSWHTNGSSGTVRGTVSYVHNNETCARTEGSTALQSALHNELIHDIRAGWDSNWADLGKRSLNLGEVRMLCEDDPDETEIPGVLLEIAFHDQPEDANALKNPLFNQLSARAVYQGIVTYFENRDGVNLKLLPEPPTHLRVTNSGANQLLVSWQSSPTDSQGYLGDAATSYRVYVSPDGFAWHAPVEVSGTSYVVPSLSAGDVVYVRVTGVNSGGESLPTEIMGARVGDAQILVVNGFDQLTRYQLVPEYDAKMKVTNLRMWLQQINAQNYVVHHGEAIGHFSGWDSTSNEAVTSGLISMQPYDVVDWILGEESVLGDGSLSTTERSLLNTYLSGGGNLFISGSEFAWDLEFKGVDTNFLHTTLHTDYIADDAQTYAVAPVGSGLFNGLPGFSFNAPGEYDADYPDVISPLAGATASLSYSGGTGGTAAIQYDGPTYQLVVMGFPFEVIQPTMRAPVMVAILEYLGTRESETWIDQPLNNSYHKNVPALYGTAVGKDLTRVEVSIYSLQTFKYWTGSGWDGLTWLPASGTTSWSYALPVLTEGSYAIYARAVGDLTDDTPAQVVFSLDSTPPGAVTLLAPADTMTQKSPVVTFQWVPPAGDASPLHYRLDLDDEQRVVDGVPYITGIENGTHVWRVAATDAAGNNGPWSGYRSFTIDALTFYLPTVLH